MSSDDRRAQPLAAPATTTGEATIAADSRDGWIGVDFDGTIAHYNGFRGLDHLGEPIPAMLERVKAWLAEGRDVRIFTARGCRGGDEQAFAYAAISEWCKRHLGRALPITRTKDMHMHELWDDRAVQVVKNTGRRADEATPPAAPAAVTDEMVDAAVRAETLTLQQIDRENREVGKPYADGSDDRERMRAAIQAALAAAASAGMPKS